MNEGGQSVSTVVAVNLLVETRYLTVNTDVRVLRSLLTTELDGV